MDMVICKVKDGIVYKAMRYKNDTLYGDLPILFEAILKDLPKNSGWQKISLDDYRDNVDSGKWEELDEEEVILCQEEEIWDN